MMEKQKETRLRILTEGGSIEICSIYKGDNDGFDYFVETSDDKPDGEEFPVIVPEIHDSFYGAFDEMNDKYPWHNLHLDFVDEDFAEYVADALIEKLNNPFDMLDDFNPENFNAILGIQLAEKKVKTKTGFLDISVSGLAKETNYYYQEFVDSYAGEIGQKFKLESTVETYSTFRAEFFQFAGTLEISGNAIILKNEVGEICHVLPADKFQIYTKPEISVEKVWGYKII